MRKQVVVCDICGSELDLREWAHLPFRKHYISHVLGGGVDICGGFCEHMFTTYYAYYIGGSPYEYM